MSKKDCEALDKYYTKESVAISCYSYLETYLKFRKFNINQLTFIEPSAGSGRMLNVIKGYKIGYDLAPEHPSIKKRNFLTYKFPNNELMELGKKNFIFFGNPPFGKKALLAIDFVNKAFTLGNIVAFIVPIQFRKWSVQSKINPNAKLVLDMELQENAFTLLDKDYSLRCCFQIWALSDDKSNDLRIQEKPTIQHPDFTMYQYNRTVEAEKFFDMPWDFAVPRQGYQDYTFKAYSKDNCDRKKQWIFFKANNNTVLDKLKTLDFTKLSKKNTGIPGFGKADVVEEYNKL
jgi:hypothetical protein